MSHPIQKIPLPPLEAKGNLYSGRGPWSKFYYALVCFCNRTLRHPSYEETVWVYVEESQGVSTFCSARQFYQDFFDNRLRGAGREKRAAFCRLFGIDGFPEPHQIWYDPDYSFMRDKVEAGMLLWTQRAWEEQVKKSPESLWRALWDSLANSLREAKMHAFLGACVSVSSRRRIPPVLDFWHRDGDRSISRRVLSYLPADDESDDEMPPMSPA